MRCRFTALALALALPSPFPAHAQSLGTVSIDGVSVRGRGHHRVMVSALDSDGTPVPGLESSFQVSADGAEVTRLRSRSLRAAFPHVHVFLVIDGGMLSGDALSGVRDGLTKLAQGLQSNDRIDVLAVGDGIRRAGSSAGHARSISSTLGKLASSKTPVLYDALYEAARSAGRGPSNETDLILLVTRGDQAGSRHKQLDVVAMATSGRQTPVLVTVISDEGGGGSEEDRLRLLATHTGGGFVRVTAAEDLAPALEAQLERGLGRWVLDFDVPDWSANQARHRLVVTAEQGGERRRADEEYRTTDVQAEPWWASPQPWVVLTMLVAIGLAIWLGTRRRAVFLLVHDGDDDDGIWYEIFGLPLTLGGEAGNDVVLADPRVSRHHAVIERRGRQVELSDLNSENGTFVNGEPITRRVLADGDLVSLGESVHLVYEAR
jgi:hypothetical protein